MPDADPSDPDVLQWRRTHRAEQGAATDRCPSAEALATLVLDEPDDDARRAMVDHVVDCRHCSSRMRDLMALHAEADLDDLEP